MRASYSSLQAKIRPLRPSMLRFHRSLLFTQHHDEANYRHTRGDNRMNDLELQQYLFDLQGYLVIENALSPKAVARLNYLTGNNAL